jgi:Plasmid pRiA4b ORF-3-like protein.
MIYRFIILSDEVDDFRRDIELDAEATFFDLHSAILESTGYEKDQMASFFLCDEDWIKRQEVTLIEMDSDPDEDNFVMEATRLNELLDEERQKLIYVFEYLTERSFFMELREIKPGKHMPKAKVTRSSGEAPPQITLFEEMDFNVPTVITNLREELFDNEVNLDEYDEDDFGGLTEDNPFDNF